MIDNFKHDTLAALLDDRLFTGEGSLDLPIGQSIIARIEVEVPTIFELTGVSYEEKYHLELFEGGDSTGGTERTPISVNRSKPTRPFLGTIIVGAEYDGTGELLRERVVDTTKKTYGDFEGGTGKLLLSPDTPYFFKITNLGTKTNTIGWVTRYVFVKEVL